MPVSSEILDRLPPQNLDAEKGVLGSLLLDSRLCHDVALVIRPEDFYADAHQRLYRRLLAMFDADQAIDETTLVEQLRKAGDLEAVGGVAYLAEVVHAVPYAANAVYYARIVREKAALRAIIQAATEVLRDAYESTEEPRTILDRAQQALQGVDRHRGAIFQTAAQLAIEVGDYVDAVMERGQHLGLPTGLPEFDERIGGLFGGELIILAARPSVGKSALAAQIADYAASSGRSVYVASLEMTGRELAMRTICSISNVSGQTIRNGKLTAGDRARLVGGMAEFARRKLILDTRAELTVEELARTVRRLVRNGLELVVVDYLGLMRATDAKTHRYEQVSHQTRQLKLLARETGVRLLVLCQLNRANAEEAGPPQLHHLRESGSIEQDADTVLFIHRPDGGILLPDPENNRQKIKADWPAELLIAKQRNGTTGRFKLDWEPRFTRFGCFGYQRDAFEEFNDFAG